jgi:hypothetical protein
MGPYEAWQAVRGAMGAVGAAVEEFERSMHWQPQIPTPDRRGPGRPRKDASDPGAELRAAPSPPVVATTEDDARIVTSVAEILIPDEPEEAPAPKRRNHRRRAAENGSA